MEGIPLIDMHCHLDFAGNAAELAAAYAACGGALSGTCDPRDFERVRSKLAPYAPRVRVGLGLHPWWVADGTCGEGEVALFERLAPGASLISEVGLDFQPRRAETRDAQIAAFERVCVASARPLGEGEAAGRPAAGLSQQSVVSSRGETGRPGNARHATRSSAEFPRRIMSIHSSRAAMCTLDVLERTGCLDACTCIFHWFSGSQEELTRAVASGCLFSVNERMLKTKRGRAYARAIPEGRLLIETDFPSKPTPMTIPQDVSPRLERTMSLLAEARGADERSLAATIAATSERLLLS
ncbi:TatD family hydrolase [uncultured Ellagibacter sp.]|uniref:TatD family hydrolase n=1 Tax=uncultured Ellagibacter sp. TaxID=2137580 RepID=UPI003457109C